MPIISNRVMDACRTGDMELLRKYYFPKYMNVNKKDSVSRIIDSLEGLADVNSLLLY